MMNDLFFSFKVNKKCNLSPGKYLQSYGATINSKRKTKYKRSISKEGKRNRLRRKELKFQHEASHELREGQTYSSGIALADTQEDDITVIPAPIVEPASAVITRDLETNEVVFDLETTGRCMKPDIIQIAAKHESETFSAYVLPTQHFIPSCITDITGISFRDGNMFFKGEKVDGIQLRRCFVKIY